MSDIIQFDYRQHWQERDIILKRRTSGDTSLGFTIAGGTDTPFLHPNFTSIIVKSINENRIVHTDEGLNDHGIFITDIAQYQTNKQLYKGDRLLQISSACNTYDLRFVTHEIAKQHIQLACSESKKIILRVGRTTPIVEA
ncbi:unnamed protein product [Rotaria sp. Silwood1]|nr:unnamed protein product [Rotaria sp. Silwood1]